MFLGKHQKQDVFFVENPVTVIYTYQLITYFAAIRVVEVIKCNTVFSCLVFLIQEVGMYVCTYYREGKTSDGKHTIAFTSKNTKWEMVINVLRSAPIV